MSASTSPVTASGDVTTAPLLAALRASATALAGAGRDDLAQRARVAAARVARPHTVVCVVGEFKQGKSLLVNALLGQQVCPVDDDLATSVVTVIQQASEPSVVVLRREAGERVRDRIDPGSLATYVTEAGNPGNVLGVEQVAIGIDNPLLASGYALVDTPGVGGLGAGHAAATLAFLPYADAVVLVSDASAELSAPELDFLQRATELGPQVVVALAKTDLHPDWRVIAERDRAHLAAAAPGVALLPVSARAAVVALERQDPALWSETGVDEVIDHLDATALDRARTGAAGRAAAEVLVAVATARAALADERAALEQPELAATRRGELDDAIARLEHLRGPASRWNQRLADATSDLTSQATFRFRSAMRDLGRATDERIEALDSPRAWDDLGRQLQSDVATVVTDVFAFVEERSAAVRRELLELVAVDAASPEADVGELAIEQLLAVRLRELTEVGRLRAAAGGGVGALRGAQSGLMILGLLGRFVPAGAAALLFSNPVTLVLGAAFAGKAVVDVRARALADRRIRARGAVRQYLDDVQFEVSNELADQLRRRQRDLREEITTLVGEASRTLTDLAERLRADLSTDAAGRTERLQRIAALDGALIDAEAALQASAGPGATR